MCRRLIIQNKNLKKNVVPIIFGNFEQHFDT